MNLVPNDVIKSRLKSILLAIPEGAGRACVDGDSWNESRAAILPLVEATLLAQKELYEFEKEARRDCLA